MICFIRKTKNRILLKIENLIIDQTSVAIFVNTNKKYQSIPYGNDKEITNAFILSLLLTCQVLTIEHLINSAFSLN